MVKLEGAEKEGAITPSKTAHKLPQGGECHRVTDGSMEMSLNAIRRSLDWVLGRTHACWLSHGPDFRKEAAFEDTMGDPGAAGMRVTVTHTFTVRQ